MPPFSKGCWRYACSLRCAVHKFQKMPVVPIRLSSFSLSISLIVMASLVDVNEWSLWCPLASICHAVIVTHDGSPPLRIWHRRHLTTKRSSCIFLLLRSCSWRTWPMNVMRDGPSNLHRPTLQHYNNQLWCYVSHSNSIQVLWVLLSVRISSFPCNSGEHMCLEPPWHDTPR